MLNKDGLLRSIVPGMKLDKPFFLKVYGYELSYPGFAETALGALEDAGCSNARRYYEQITTEYEEEQAAQIKPVAAWLSEEIDRKYEEMMKKNDRRKGDLNGISDWHRFKGFPSIR